MQHRATFTRKAALKFLPYLELLLDQIKEKRIEGMFISTSEFGGISPNTLQVRFSDGLLWLTRHNVDDKTDRRQDFQNLRDNLKTKKEAGGLRIWIMAAPVPLLAVRTKAEVVPVSNWKDDVMAYLEDDDAPRVKMFENIILTSEELDWVKRVVGNILGAKASISVSGDRLIICRE